MKKYMVLFLLMQSVNMFAQEGNNWVIPNLNESMGINWGNKDSMLYKVNSIWNPYTQSISNCEGKLMLYSTGQYLWNSKQQRLRDTVRSSYFYNAIIIPNPSNDSVFYYIFSNGRFRYYTVDLRLDSGRGNITDTIPINITDSVSIFGGFTKHANGRDYWLLVKVNEYQVRSYLVSDSGISKTYISSNMLGVTSTATGGDNHGLRFSNNGKMVVSPFTRITFSLGWSNIYIYDFDNKSGKCSNQRLLLRFRPGLPFYNTYAENGVSFSPNDSLIYCQYSRMTVGGLFILQFQTYSNDIPKSCDTILRANSNYESNGMQLAPDNKIYFWIRDTIPSFRLSSILYPDKKGKDCEIKLYNFSTFPYNISSLNVANFPCYNFPIKRINNHFTVTGAYGCGTDTVRFRMDADSSFHSAWWYFGDGDSSQEFYIRDSLGNKQWQGITHQYKQEGSYYVRLACGLGTCGYKQWVGDSITIQFKPNLKFTTNKNIYCGYQTIDANLNYNYTDTLKLSWGDGTDTLLIKGSTAILDSNTLQHTYTQNGNYTISCKAWNTHCQDSQAITYPVYISAKPQALFTTNNKASCGSSTFTFIDTSGFDSIVNYRYWRITPPNGNTYTQATTNTNLLNQTLSDTGSYHITLVVESNQGCVDSLTQLNYISVYPLPNTTMTPSGKVYICYNDSVKLTIANNTKYLWNTGDTTPSIYIKKQGNYSATVWNSYNCTSKTANTTAQVLAPFNATIIKTTDSLYIQTNRAIKDYQWLKDSMPFSGNTQRSISNPTNGNYTATITDTNGCQTKTNSVKVYNGIETLNTNSTIYIYPNPTQNILYIETITTIKTITLQDLTGKQIPIAPTNNKTTTQLNLSSLAKGVYILKVNEVYKKVVVE